MEGKIRFVEYIVQQVEAGNVTYAHNQHWYNEGAEYSNDDFKVRIKTSFFLRRQTVELLRYTSPYWTYLKYTPEEKEVLLGLLPKALEVRRIANAKRDQAWEEEKRALEWWP